MTFFRRTVAWSNQFLDRESVVLRNMVPHITFDITDPEILSGRHRLLSVCVLRRRGSEPETRWTGVMAASLQASATLWRTLAMLARQLSAANGCRGKKCDNV